MSTPSADLLLENRKFLTHMHGDHAFGLVPFLCALADGAGGVVEGMDWREREALRSVCTVLSGPPF